VRFGTMEKLADVLGVEPEEIERIRQGSFRDRFHELSLVAVHTGLRSGELRALMWRDLDW
jgi:integrase